MNINREINAGIFLVYLPTIISLIAIVLALGISSSLSWAATIILIVIILILYALLFMYLTSGSWLLPSTKKNIRTGKRLAKRVGGY